MLRDVLRHVTPPCVRAVVMQKARLEKWQSGKPSENKTYNMPRNRVLRLAFRLCRHPAFDIVLYVAIFINVILVFAEMITTFQKGCLSRVESRFYTVFNFIFIVIYTLEAFFKVRVLAAMPNLRISIFDRFLSLLSVYGQKVNLWTNRQIFRLTVKITWFLHYLRAIQCTLLVWLYV